MLIVLEPSIGRFTLGWHIFGNDDGGACSSHDRLMQKKDREADVKSGALGLNSSTQ